MPMEKTQGQEEEKQGPSKKTSQLRKENLRNLDSQSSLSLKQRRSGELYKGAKKEDREPEMADKVSRYIIEQ